MKEYLNDYMLSFDGFPVIVHVIVIALVSLVMFNLIFLEFRRIITRVVNAHRKKRKDMRDSNEF